MSLRGRVPRSRVTRLTERQRAVALLIADGFTDKQIAARLTISADTVGVHVHRIGIALRVDPSRNVRVQIACHFVRLSAA